MVAQHRDCTPMSLSSTLKMAKFYTTNIFTQFIFLKVSVVFSREGRTREPFLHFWFRAKWLRQEDGVRESCLQILSHKAECGQSSI